MATGTARLGLRLRGLRRRPWRRLSSDDFDRRDHEEATTSEGLQQGSTAIGMFDVQGWNLDVDYDLCVVLMSRSLKVKTHTAVRGYRLCMDLALDDYSKIEILYELSFMEQRLWSFG